MKRRRTCAGLAFLLAAVWTGSATARVPFTSDTPWYLLAGGGTFAVDAGLTHDGDSAWQTSSFGLTTTIPSQSSGVFYLRWRFISFDDGGRSALVRWPEIADSEADTTDLVAWSAEKRHDGWGRPELGMLGLMHLPGLGSLNYAAAAWLPFADNKLYPFAAQSVSLRGSVRKRVRLPGAITMAFSASHTANLNAAGNLLAAGAFGECNVLGIAGFWTPAIMWNFAAAIDDVHGDDEGRQVLSFVVAREFSSHGQLVLSWNSTLGGQEERPFASSFGLSWRLTLSSEEDPQDEPSPAP